MENQNEVDNIFYNEHSKKKKHKREHNKKLINNSNDNNHSICNEIDNMIDDTPKHIKKKKHTHEFMSNSNKIDSYSYNESISEEVDNESKLQSSQRKKHKKELKNKLMTNSNEKKSKLFNHSSSNEVDNILDHEPKHVKKKKHKTEHHNDFINNSSEIDSQYYNPNISNEVDNSFSDELKYSKKKKHKKGNKEDFRNNSEEINSHACNQNNSDIVNKVLDCKPKHKHKKKHKTKDNYEFINNPGEIDNQFFSNEVDNNIEEFNHRKKKKHECMNETVSFSNEMNSPFDNHSKEVDNMFNCEFKYIKQKKHKNKRNNEFNNSEEIVTQFNNQSINKEVHNFHSEFKHSKMKKHKKKYKNEIESNLNENDSIFLNKSISEEVDNIFDHEPKHSKKKKYKTEHKNEFMNDLGKIDTDTYNQSSSKEGHDNIYEELNHSGKKKHKKEHKDKVVDSLTKIISHSENQTTCYKDVSDFNNELEQYKNKQHTNEYMTNKSEQSLKDVGENFQMQNNLSLEKKHKKQKKKQLDEENLNILNSIEEPSPKNILSCTLLENEIITDNNERKTKRKKKNLLNDYQNSPEKYQNLSTIYSKDTANNEGDNDLNIQIENNTKDNYAKELNEETLNANKDLIQNKDIYSYFSSDEENVQNYSKVNYSVPDEDYPEFEIPLLHKKESVGVLSKEELESFKSKGVIIKTGKWTKEEILILKRNYDDFTQKFDMEDPYFLFGFEQGNRSKESHNYLKYTHFYVRLGKDLNDRTLRSIYMKARSLFHPLKDKSKAETDEILYIRNKQSQIGSKWVKIARPLERSAKNVSEIYRWNGENLNKGRWSEEEIKMLKYAVEKVAGNKKDLTDFNQVENISWKKVAELVPSRNFSQCRHYWAEHMMYKDDIKWAKCQFSEFVTLLRKKCYVKDESKINWKKLQEYLKNISPSYVFLQKRWRYLKIRAPNSVKRNYRELLKYWMNHYMINDESVKDS